MSTPLPAQDIRQVGLYDLSWGMSPEQLHANPPGEWVEREELFKATFKDYPVSLACRFRKNGLQAIVMAPLTRHIDPRTKKLRYDLYRQEYLNILVQLQTLFGEPTPLQHDNIEGVRWHTEHSDIVLQYYQLWELKAQQRGDQK